MKSGAEPIVEVYLPGSEEKIKPSIFPGILGFSWQTDNYQIGNLQVKYA